jgi:hypothetical protein
MLTTNRDNQTYQRCLHQQQCQQRYSFGLCLLFVGSFSSLLLLLLLLLFWWPWWCAVNGRADRDCQL